MTVSNKTAILQVADTGPLNSLVHMLTSVGYKCYTPNDELKKELRGIGCDTVLDIEGLVRGWGYEYPIKLPQASPVMMLSCNLYVDVKGIRNCQYVERVWPNLKGKILWYRINGGEPEHVIRTKDCSQCIKSSNTNSELQSNPLKCQLCNNTGKIVIEDCGNEIDPPCPVLTPNQWYKHFKYGQARFYTCWPTFMELNDYLPKHGRPSDQKHYTDPICLIHNFKGWGYGELGERLRSISNLKIYGGGSPDGLTSHTKIPNLLSTSVAMVHLKSNDAPGYALYEAMAAGCPIIASERLIWRCQMQDLLVPGKTCLTFDKATHDPLSEQDITECVSRINHHLYTLRNKEYNNKLGLAGRTRLKQIMWDSREDNRSFESFLEKNIAI